MTTQPHHRGERAKAPDPGAGHRPRTRAPASTIRKTRHESLRAALTKRALEKQFMRAGLTRRTAETEVSRLTQKQRWQRLSEKNRAEIAWKIATQPENER